MLYEVEKWDTNGVSHVWVQIPALTNSASIWAYWGNASLTNAPDYTHNGTAWDSDYEMVWHIQETTNSLAPDSTSHNRDGFHTSSSSTWVSGLAGDAVTFDDDQSDPAWSEATVQLSGAEAAGAAASGAEGENVGLSIAVGDHQLEPNTPDQQILIYVFGGLPVEGVLAPGWDERVFDEP